MTPDPVRELAERLGVLRPCGCDAGTVDGFGECIVCEGTGFRLPTEAEVRAAIFEADWNVLLIRAEPDFARVEVCRPSEQRDANAVRGEADNLVLLALLRALEAARR
jgi:hypothetical protein